MWGDSFLFFFITASNIRIRNSHITGNKATNGGALYAESGASITIDTNGYLDSNVAGKFQESRKPHPNYSSKM